MRDQFSEFKAIFSQYEIDKLGKFEVVEESNFSSLQKFREILSFEVINEIHNLENQFGRSK